MNLLGKSGMVGQEALVFRASWVGQMIGSGAGSTFCDDEKKHRTSQGYKARAEGMDDPTDPRGPCSQAVTKQLPKAIAKAEVDAKNLANISTPTPASTAEDMKNQTKKMLDRSTKAIF